MFTNGPKKQREPGTLNAKVGDLVELNPDSMLSGGGLAVIIEVDKDIEGLYRVRYVASGYETTVDDWLDIIKIVGEHRE